MNQLSEQQVEAAFKTAGLVPLESPTVLAHSVNGMLAAAQQGYASIPFTAEPAHFALALSKGRA